ncbi:MAG: TldD/PmbA family protein [Bradymonadales bacterium]|nr:TldD/PmbA family protein [Bradymonadales bacterium]
MTEGPVLSDEAALKDLADAILDHVQPRCTYADLLAEVVTKTEVNLLSSGELVAKAYTGKAAIQVRMVGSEGRHVEISLGLGSFETLKPDLDGALDLLALVQPDPDYGLADVPNPDRQRYGFTPDPDIRTTDAGGGLLAIVEEIQATARQVCDKLAEEGRTIQLVPEVWAYSLVEEKLVMDMRGLFKTQVLPTTFVQLLSRARENDKLAQTRIRFGDIRSLSHLLDGGHLKPAYSALVCDCMERSIALLGTGRLTEAQLEELTHIVLAPSAMVFIHEAQGHNFEADIIQRNGSGLFDPQGNAAVDPLGSALVDLYDGPPCDGEGRLLADRGFGTQFIDDEGVELQRVALVQQGRITGRLHNRQTAYYYQETPNGHGFSELGDIRVVRMTNTYLFPADRAHWTDSLEELVADIGRGILLEGSFGGAVSKEGMSTSIQFGRRIVDGRLTGEIFGPLNLTVKTLGALAGIEGFAGVPDMEGIGFCGKEYQTKPVTDGGPYTRIAVSDAITLGY